MVPVLSKTFVSGKPVAGLIAKDKLDGIVKRTCDRGAEIVALLGTGSAFYSPSAAVFEILKAIDGDIKQTIAVSVYLSGEYGLEGVCIGVPCVIGKTGVEKIIEIELSKEEKEAFLRSARAIKSSIDLL